MEYSFWGHTIYSWDEIVAPNILSEANAWDDSAFEGMSVDYHRFTSDSLLENFISEKKRSENMIWIHRLRRI